MSQAGGTRELRIARHSRGSGYGPDSPNQHTWGGAARLG